MSIKGYIKGNFLYIRKEATDFRYNNKDDFWVVRKDAIHSVLKRKYMHNDSRSNNDEYQTFVVWGSSNEGLDCSYCVTHIPPQELFGWLGWEYPAEFWEKHDSIAAIGRAKEDGNDQEG